jgi:hypothetical protein
MLATKALSNFEFTLGSEKELDGVLTIEGESRCQLLSPAWEYNVEDSFFFLFQP